MSGDVVALAVARGRREGLAEAREFLARELRGAPFNAPGRTQLTYVGGLARGRRIVEHLYRRAAAAEEDLVIGVDASERTAAPEPS